MHLHFERTVNARSDCSILSLTWMGKVPDELPEDEGWKLNRTNYYQEGWLATGNVRGIVGVTFTTSHCKKNVEFPLRTNYNLRGHRSEVILVKWNEPYQKLASCDSSGIIFVWIKYEGRWSIELINDRNTPVTHFSWSHDGRMALICYQDGFVLVGSVAGQRYWSSMLNLESTISCGIWTPDDQQVYFGTTSGQIIVMDVHGAMVSQVQLSSDVGISSMAWSCEKFKMEEGEDSDPGVTNAADRQFVLAVSLQNGFIYLLKTFDDVSPIQIDTKLQGALCMEWSNSRELLAVAGISPHDSKAFPVGAEFNNLLKFYNERGILLYSINIPHGQTPVSAITWGHNDKRLFLATGTQIHIAWISRRIASLQLMCRLRIHNSLQSDTQLSNLPLPPRIRSLIGNLFAQTIRCCVPEASALREFVSRPPGGSVRLHCTMIRHDDESNLSSGTCYTLYLEYLGGLVPLLKGKRTSKIRPEFVIFDPQVEDICGSMQWSPDSGKSSASSQSTSGSGAHSDSSDSDREDGCSGSPRMQRRKKKRNKNNNRITQPERQAGQNPTDGEVEDLAYIDTLPEHVRLVEVTSNIWGTKFKIHGLATSVPANLGQVTYKTSLLHLQPRQMTLVMTELRDDFSPGPDPNFNPNVFSEDEEEAIALEERKRLRPGSADHAVPIAPMSPIGNRLNRPKSQIFNNFLNTEPISSNILKPALARAESYEDEIPSTTARPHCLSNTSQIVTSPSQQLHTGIVSSPRQPISPLCEENSLKSPKASVAPSTETIFETPSMQTLVYSPTEFYGIIPDNSGNNKRNSLMLNLDTANITISTRNTVTESTKIKNQISDATDKNNELNKSPSECNGNTTKSFQIKDGRKQYPIRMSGKEIRYIDEEQHNDNTQGPSNASISSNLASICITDSIVRSCSVGFLDLMDAQLVPSDIALHMLRKDTPKRLVLVNNKSKQKKLKKQHNHEKVQKLGTLKSPNLSYCGKSKSLDSSDIFPKPEHQSLFLMSKNMEAVLDNTKTDDIKHKQIIKTRDQIEINTIKKDETNTFFSSKKSPILKRKKSDDPASPKNKARNRNKQVNSSQSVPNKSTIETTPMSSPVRNTSLHAQALNTLENLLLRLRDLDDNKSSPPSSPRMPRSSPASPAPTKKSKRPQSASPIRKHLLGSPLLGRRSRKNKPTESSDDEIVASGDEIVNSKNFKDLETFQKAQLRQKLKRVKIEPNGSCINQPAPQRREFVMHNKAPMWNENSQVYQLDFGGRVTQESAKNFQIEFRGKQVMQFGRIDGNAYTLDFQYPFSALQAFAVALANVTQRLK